ncbi:MAG TPA: tetratricopeptide repeat protein, partial [Terriglobales bacterium]|nr:tetratricopeptide repeat protein [Terriglobales bacterium]
RQFMIAKSNNPEAHEAYLKGRYFWNRRTESDYLTAIKYFEEAIGHDPGYASAYAGLADTYALLGSFPNSEITRAEAMARAKTAAEEALQLDDSLAEAHTSLGFVKMHYDWDWDGAELEFQRAIQLNPSYANAYHWHAYNLMAMNRLDDAIAELRRARGLDPLSAIMNADLCEALSFAGRSDEAIKQGEVAVALDPSFPLAHQELARAYLGKHMFSEAVREEERAIELAPDSPWMQSYLAEILAYEGRKQEARAILKQLRPVVNTASNGVPLIYAALGDADDMFRELEKSYSGREGSLILLNCNTEYAPYRTDPRFRDLVRRVGLPQ